MLPCCSRRQRSRVGASGGVFGAPRGDDTRLREREFDDGVDSEAEKPLGSEQVENPLAWEEPHSGSAEFRDADDNGSDDEMETQPLRPVALVPRGWAAPDPRADTRAQVLASSAQLPPSGAAGDVCYIGNEQYECMRTGGWVLVANECGRLEMWERGLPAETRKLVAFEVLIRSIAAHHGVQAGEDQDEDVIDALRVHFQIRYSSTTGVARLATSATMPSGLTTTHCFGWLVVGRCTGSYTHGRRWVPDPLANRLTTLSLCCASGNMKTSTLRPTSTNGLIGSSHSSSPARAGRRSGVCGYADQTATHQSSYSISTLCYPTRCLSRRNLM